MSDEQEASVEAPAPGIFDLPLTVEGKRERCVLVIVAMLFFTCIGSPIL